MSEDKLKLGKGVEAMFPVIAKYVRGYGYIEIGDQESFGFVVRAIGYGGMNFEDDSPNTLAEAMVVLEAGVARWFEEQRIEKNWNRAGSALTIR